MWIENLSRLLAGEALLLLGRRGRLLSRLQPESHLVEHLADPCPVLGRHLEHHLAVNIVVVGVLQSTLGGDGAGTLQVQLVAHQHRHRVQARAGRGADRVVSPVGEGVKGVRVVNAVDQYGDPGPPEVGLGDGAHMTLDASRVVQVHLECGGRNES